MYIKNNPDFKTVWQLAHDWVGADLDKTDTRAIEPELRIAIHRLMLAMIGREISARWKGLRIFRDDSFLSMIFDIFHDIKFLNCLGKNKFEKNYLDNLYVKRNEVINWCLDSLLDPPPCWSYKKSTANNVATNELIDPDDENNSWYDKITERRRQRVVCIELAKQLWKVNPNLSYDEMQSHSIMQQYGYSSTFTFKSFRNLVRVVASESAQSPGAPIKPKE